MHMNRELTSQYARLAWSIPIVVGKAHGHHVDTVEFLIIRTK